METTRAFLIMVSILGLLCVPMIAGDCQEPSNVKEIKQGLQDEIRDNYMESMSYFNIKHILNEVTHKLNISYPDSDGNVLLSRIYGDLKCRRRHQLGSGLKQTHERSSCPWYYALEIDTDREPQAIVKAKCSCRRCLEGSRRRSKKGSKCEEISYLMPVIRRQCVGDVYTYGIFLENVAVGCTCQRSVEKVINNEIVY